MIPEPQDGTLVSIVVPSLNRPGPLARALASLASQTGLGPDRYEIVVVDNAPDANARGLVASTAASAAVPVRYVHAAEPGIATARNAGVAAASGAWVAFLDDDETAGPAWLAALLTTARRTGADAVFGPVTAQGEEGRELGAMAAYFSRRIDLPTGADITDRAAYLGTNNSMFRRDRCLPEPEPFEPLLNSVGGEDSLLLKRLVAAGRRLTWSAEAGIVEWVPAKRMSWTYIRRRKFLSGQIRTFVFTMTDPPSWPRVGLWMAVGAAQSVLAGSAALATWPVRSGAHLRWTATLFGALGKVFWARRFRPSLYGRGLVS